MRQNKRFMLTALLALVAIMALCFTLAACNAKEYSVNLQFEESQGNVELSPATENGKYKEGTELTVTVTPKTGYVLDEFKLSTDSNAALNSNGKFVFTVSQDTTINVTFKPEPKQKYTLTVPTVENGEIKVSPTSPDNKYDEGTQITITLEPAVGYEVSEFTVDSVDKKSELQDNVYSFSIEKETSINASFSKKQYNVTTEVKGVSEKGSISLAPQKSTYEYGDQVTVTVTVQYGHGITPQTFKVSTDEEAVLSDENTYTLTVSADTQIEVTIHEHVYTSWKVNDLDPTRHSSFCDVCDDLFSENHSSMYVIFSTTAEKEILTCSKNCGFTRDRDHDFGDKWIDDGNGKCHQACRNTFPVCDYETEPTDHDMDWHQLATASEGHTGSCKHCGYTVEKEAHNQDGEGGACSKCGYIDAGEHTCIEHVVADANGFYDGECQLCHQNAIFTIDSLTGKITKFENYSTLIKGGELKIKVPAKVNGFDVKDISTDDKAVFRNNTDITHIVIDENANYTVAATSLFNGCSKLKSIVVLASWTEIKMQCFNGCTSLEYIVLPATLTKIAGAGFGSTGKCNTIYFLGNAAQQTTLLSGITNKVWNTATWLFFGDDPDTGWKWTDDSKEVPQANK